MKAPDSKLTREEFKRKMDKHGRYRKKFDARYERAMLRLNDNFDDIEVEREYQLAKFGDEVLAPSEMLAILGEEYGEACKAYLEQDKENYRAELVQIATTAIKALWCFDRMTGRIKK